MAWRLLRADCNPVRVSRYGSASRLCREALATPSRDPRPPPDDLFRPGLRPCALLPGPVLRPLPAAHGHGRPARRQAGTDCQVHDREMRGVQETQTVCTQPLLALLRAPTVTGSPVSGFTADSKCPEAPDGHHLWSPGTSKRVEVVPGVYRYEMVRTCVLCGREEPL